MDVSIAGWIALGALVVVLLLVDLALFGRGTASISLRRAIAWSVVWMVLGLAFAAVLWWWQGRSAGQEYLAGFLIEKSLSVDNLFVFAMVFTYFGVPAAYQRRVIFWGIVGAIVLRGAFIAAGAALLDAAHWSVYAFGAFLVLTGIRMARHAETEIHPERNLALRVLRRVVPLTHRIEGPSFVVREGGLRKATPLVAALVLVATLDVVFAADSIPAIFAVTRETFIVASANAFSLLGLSALYFVLAGMMARFRYLNVGLAIILVFVGAKMLLVDVYAIPVYLSLAVIVGVLGATVGVSLFASRSAAAPGAPASQTPPA